MKDTSAALSPKGLVIFILAFLFYNKALLIYPFVLNFGLGKTYPLGSTQDLEIGLITHAITD
jgi:hypothetical protein